MAQIIEEKRWTYEDYLRLTDGKRYEIAGGRLSTMVPAPEFNHQRIAMTLAVKFYLFVEKHGLGYVVDAPTDVILDEETLYSLIFYLSQGQTKMLSGKRGFLARQISSWRSFPRLLNTGTSMRRKIYTHGFR